MNTEPSTKAPTSLGLQSWGWLSWVNSICFSKYKSALWEEIRTCGSHEAIRDVLTLTSLPDPLFPCSPGIKIWTRGSTSVGPSSHSLPLWDQSSGLVKSVRELVTTVHNSPQENWSQLPSQGNYSNHNQILVLTLVELMISFLPPCGNCHFVWMSDILVIEQELKPKGH